jgi:hypothetical protein
MKLHCEVEVVSRHLPTLGLRNRGKGIRTVLSLCQQSPRSQLRPACLLISTMKDKRGTRYEVRGTSRQGQGTQLRAPPRTEKPAARMFLRLKSAVGIPERWTQVPQILALGS